MNEARDPAARERPLRPCGPLEAGPAATNFEPLAGSSDTCALCVSVPTTSARNADPPICVGHIARICLAASIPRRVGPTQVGQIDLRAAVDPTDAQGSLEKTGESICGFTARS
jgi:hypothetical protein